MRRLVVSVVGFAVVAAMSVGVAHADGTYHSGHYALAPVSGAPLRSGFVENIHPNGPHVYAHEQYVLNGAQPLTSYQVVINLFPGDRTCSSTPLAFPTATLTTNAAGNGTAYHVFTPDDAAGLRGMTVGVQWFIEADGVVVYATGCETVRLD
jgi:hypothetical protein